jgi:hypothetical protein
VAILWAEGEGVDCRKVSNSLIGWFSFVLILFAILELVNTKEKLLILAKAFGSFIKTDTWFSHLEGFNTVTPGMDRRLSKYLAVTGKSVLSIAIANRWRRTMALSDK